MQASVKPVKTKKFVGKKVTIEKMLNKPIIVQDYKITQSKYNSGSLLTLSIYYQEKPYILFTGSSYLINDCKKYYNCMLFATKIIYTNRHYSFCI